ncbi:MAG: hypothetical protein HY923_09455 [Elusimicrobia bacterium]|nr:hypothetical protein [Elusimicrobiota bacterium]
MELIPLLVFWVSVFEAARLMGKFKGESRKSAYTLAAGIWAIVTVYAILHDQYIVRLAPEHFTVYHDPMWGLRRPRAIALAYAFRGLWYPGILLGMACTLAARADSMPRLRPRFVLKGVVGVTLLTEFISIVSGIVAYQRGQGIYPAGFYPDPRPILQVTQTIQLTGYWSSALWCCFMIGVFVGLRYGPDGLPGSRAPQDSFSGSAAAF